MHTLEIELIKQIDPTVPDKQQELYLILWSHIAIHGVISRTTYYLFKHANIVQFPSDAKTILDHLVLGLLKICFILVDNL